MDTDTKYGHTGRKIWRNATLSVLSNLQTPTPGDVTYGPVGCTLRMHTMEEFREHAMDWLCDHSNLALRTMERADWDEIHTFFKEYGKDRYEA